MQPCVSMCMSIINHTTQLLTTDNTKKRMNSRRQALPKKVHKHSTYKCPRLVMPLSPCWNVLNGPTCVRTLCERFRYLYVYGPRIHVKSLRGQTHVSSRIGVICRETAGECGCNKRQFQRMNVQTIKVMHQAMNDWQTSCKSNVLWHCDEIPPSSGYECHLVVAYIDPTAQMARNIQEWETSCTYTIQYRHFHS